MTPACLWTAFSPELMPLLMLLIDVCGVIAGLYLFLRGFRLLQRKRWIEDTPVSKIAGAAIGPVKIAGRAAGPYTLLSPLSEVDCYYYRAVAWNGQDAKTEELSSRATETLFTPLFVEDETGRLLIDPRGAQLELPALYDGRISGSSMTEGERHFLDRHGLSTEGSTTVCEYVIQPGDSLLALGTLAENYRAGSGIPYLSSEAADLQRREQLEAMGISRAELPARVAEICPGFNLDAGVVLQAGKVPFVISRAHPQQLTERLARGSVIDIWGGSAVALLSLGLLLKSLGAW
jgi:hypothetical protein